MATTVNPLSLTSLDDYDDWADRIEREARRGRIWQYVDPDGDEELEAPAIPDPANYYRPENHEDEAIPAPAPSRGRRTRASARAGQVQPALPHIEVHHLSSEEASTFRIALDL